MKMWSDSQGYEVLHPGFVDENLYMARVLDYRKKGPDFGHGFFEISTVAISSRAKVISCKVSAEDREFNLEYVR